MKKYFNVLIVTLILFTMIFAVTVVSAEDQSLEEIKEKGYFVVGLDDSFPPMGFRNEKGEIDGFDIDMAKEAAQRMGVDVKFKPVEWDGVLLSLINGNIDIIWNGLTITEKRAEKIAFSQPYRKDREIIVVEKDSHIKYKNELKGKIVGIQMGSSSVAALNSEPEIAENLKELRKYPNNTEALMDLKTGRISAVVVDEVVGRYYVISKSPEDYKILSEHFGKESFAVGLRKEDKAFKNELNRVLREMKADGTADKIANDWFSDNKLLIK